MRHWLCPLYFTPTTHSDMATLYSLACRQHTPNDVQSATNKVCISTQQDNIRIGSDTSECALCAYGRCKRQGGCLTYLQNGDLNWSQFRFSGVDTTDKLDVSERVEKALDELCATS